MRNKPIHNETPATFTPGFSFSGSPVESGRLDEPTSQVSIHFPPMSDTDDEDDAFFFDAVYDPMVSDPNPKEAFGAGDSPRFDGDFAPICRARGICAADPSPGVCRTLSVRLG